VLEIVQWDKPAEIFRLDWQRLPWDGHELYRWAEQRSFLSSGRVQLSFGSHHSGKLPAALFACGLAVERCHWHRQLSASMATELADQLREILPANTEVRLTDPARQ
jgi:hypothetical protein